MTTIGYGYTFNRDNNVELQLRLRARRNMESQIFGLYDDSLNVTPEEARSVYRMFQLHRNDILENERNWVWIWTAPT